MRNHVREILGVCLLLTLLLCAYAFGFGPMSRQRAALLDEVQQRRATMARVEQATLGLTNLRSELQETQTAIAYFESRLPAEKELGQVLDQLNDLAQRSSLKTRVVRELRTERGIAFSEQEIELELLGSFAGFYSFLQELERLPRITRVTHLELSREPQLTAHLRLSIFFEPQPTKAAS